MKKGLYIVATPIGNLNDVSARAIEILSNAEVIACEDTRVTKKLFSLLGISLKKNFIALHNFNEEEQAPKIVEEVMSGKSVALVSDAGSPLISDPGYKLIKKCKEAGIYICTIPGCCALVCALQLSGLPTNRFMFAGFIPNKEKARKDFFEPLKKLDATLIFYETAPRILKSLQAAKDVFGNREMSVAREITKLYEECLTADVDELILHFSEKEAKGEMVFMVAPFDGDVNEDIDLEKLLLQKLAEKSLKDAVKEIVETYKFNKNEVYELALKIKNDK
ncbi:MAG: 16S rRNA (cytidine(1402)-2'-O)-methyltransferase [Alphaproteobacteria bacterium]|nr:16S rRNA (cytidine(1402)-2'-O)-methyltransferase [Alphaproteobacteria bacterium]